MVPNLEARYEQLNESWRNWRYIEGLALIEALIEDGLPLDTDIGNGISLEFSRNLFRRLADREAERAVSELRIRRVHFKYSNYTATLGIFERTQMPDGTPAWCCFHDLFDETNLPWLLEKFPHALDQRDLPVIRDEDAIKIPTKGGYYRRYLLD